MAKQLTPPVNPLFYLPVEGTSPQQGKGMDEDMQPKPEPDTQPVPESGTNPVPDTPPAPSPEPQPETPPQPSPDKGTATDTQTGTDTLLDELIKPTVNYVRHVCYLDENQSKFVKRMAKKKHIKESEIFRIAIDYLIKNMSK